MYETIRIIKKTRPRFVLWENVVGLLSDKHRKNYNAYLNELDDMGYSNYYAVLVATDYGIPQLRRRIYTLSIRKDAAVDFEFPKGEPTQKTIRDFLQPSPGNVDFISPRLLHFFIQATERNRARGNGFGFAPTHGDGYALTITTRSGNRKTDNFLLVDETTAPKDAARFVENGKCYAVRRLSALECWRLMGFDDEDYKKAAAVSSRTQLIKQAGNSIVVNVLQAIIENIFDETKQPKYTQLTFF